jgi:hypothetical protein
VNFSLPEPIDWSEFWEKDHTSEDWLIEPILPRGRQIALYAPAKVGKSLLALDLAARAAIGLPIFDQLVGLPIEVVYMDMEMGEDDLFERLDDMGYGAHTDFSRFHYYLLPNLPPMDTAAGGEAMVRIVQRHKAKLVVIDTTSRVISGPENEADTLRNLYQHTGTRLKAEGVTLFRLDHAGKNAKAGQRGTSAKNDDVDLVWELSGEMEAFKLTATHRRQSWVPEYVNLMRKDGPFRHEIVADLLPYGAMTVVRILEELDAPCDWGAKRIRKLLRDSGHGARNELIAAAIRYRRNQASKGVPESWGHPVEDEVGTPSGTPTQFRFGDTLGDTRGHPVTE